VVFLPIISHIAQRQFGTMAQRNARPMTVSTAPAATPQPVSPRFDRKFIEDHQLIERYLTNKLPYKGARDLENWCREHPEYLSELNISERAQASLKLLEHSGQQVDLREPAAPWWKSIYMLIGLALFALISLAAFWAMVGKNASLHRELEDTRTQMRQGSLVQPAVQSALRISPDRAPDINRARINVSHTAPQLIELHLDMSYTKAMQFRMIVDKQDQGRALILDSLLKDSNGELQLTFNTTGLPIGIYTVRLEAVPSHGVSVPIGWLILDSH
jgi:hypothetical protein